MNKFPKDRYFKNLRFLLQRDEMKMGTFESQAKVKPGQTSRWEKGDALPSADYLVAVKEITKTGLDIMLEEDLYKASPNELYLSKVLEAFRKDTILGTLPWVKSEAGTRPRFVQEGGLKSGREVSYEAELPENGDKIYVVFCDNENEQEAIELYTTGKEASMNHVCSSRGASAIISRSVKRLYEAIVASNRSVTISETVRNQFDSYMRFREPASSMQKEEADARRSVHDSLGNKEEKLTSYADRIMQLQEEDK